AQGVIDNGGFQYFFESDWPDRPAYDEFVSAYRAIGLAEEAETFQRAIEWFPFPDAHLHVERRNEFIDRNGFPKELDTLCGSDRVWIKLDEYFNAYREELLAGVPAA